MAFAWVESKVLVTSVEGHHQRFVAVYHASFVFSVLLCVVDITKLSTTTNVLTMTFSVYLSSLLVLDILVYKGCHLLECLTGIVFDYAISSQN